MHDDSQTAVAMAPIATAGPRHAPPAPSRERWGEELPIFCEKCGYSLNGLKQIRCEHCAVLHFSCPECGHHQPINTLRPAFQRVLGRIRAIAVACIVFLKINFFFWVLFAWGAAGTEIPYRYDYYQTGQGTYQRAPFEIEGSIILFLFAMAFSMIGRMLLLRWRRGTIIGMTIGGLVVFAMLFGAYLHRWESSRELPSPIGDAFLFYLLSAFAGATVGGTFVWGLWRALSHAFLPKRVATSLIEWQEGMSDPANKRGDAAMSVTS